MDRFIIIGHIKKFYLDFRAGGILNLFHHDNRYFIDIPHPQIFKIQQIHDFRQNKEDLAWLIKL